MVFYILLIVVPYYNSLDEYDYYTIDESTKVDSLPVMSVEGNYTVISENENIFLTKPEETLQILCTSDNTEELELYSWIGKSALYRLSVERIVMFGVN